MTQPTFNEWMKVGIDLGFVGPPVCYVHDGVPTSQAENDELDEGDPCIHIIRCYIDAEHKKDVEMEHSPSVWRNTFKDG